MKQYKKISIYFLLIVFILSLGLNIALYIVFNQNNSNYYKVEINRLYDTFQYKGFLNEQDLIEYSYIKDFEILNLPATKKQIENFYQVKNETFIIKPFGKDEIKGYIKFNYATQNKNQFRKNLIVVNSFFALLVVILISIFIYIKNRIIKPFNQLQDMPYELSKGHLSKNIKESKNRFFGKFIWGLDLLRENLESHKNKELQLQKEKKTMVLSISHDIKTPLSSIKLYSKALQQGLYLDKEKQQNALININKKADEIEYYVNEIIKTSKEDFLNLEINNTEFYLSELVTRIKNYYSEKLELIKTDFVVNNYSDCILYGDIERCLEAMENIIENSIKYGDGKQIKISFSKEENCELISITNSGNSLPLNETIHIFESFWRGSNSNSNKGSGLGLYICRQILLKMNGDIFATPTQNQMQITMVLKLK